MQVKLTEKQAKQLIANAVNAASPVGLGILHFEQKQYSPDDVAGCLDQNGIGVDYFHGRMTKLYARRNGDTYTFDDFKPDGGYQSWASKYPTYEALVDSVLTA